MYLCWSIIIALLYITVVARGKLESSHYGNRGNRGDSLLLFWTNCKKPAAVWCRLFINLNLKKYHSSKDFLMFLGAKWTYFKIKSVDYSYIIIKCECQLCVDISTDYFNLKFDYPFVGVVITDRHLCSLTLYGTLTKCRCSDQRSPPLLLNPLRHTHQV